MVRLPCRIALLALLCALMAGAAPSIIDEDSFELRFTDTFVEARFFADPGTRARCSADIKLRWLDPNDDAHAESVTRVDLRPGRTDYVLRMPVPIDRLQNEVNVVWDRLEYTIDPTDDGCGFAEQGPDFVSISRMQASLFRLIVGLPEAAGGRKIHAIARAVHAISGYAVPGVRIEATLLDYYGKDVLARDDGITSSAGTAFLTFDRPPNQGDLDLHVRGSMGSLASELTSSIFPDYGGEIILDTDKQIYQPGETLRIRAVLFGSDGRVLGSSRARVEIDNGTEDVFSEVIQATRFGVIAAEYPIPANAQLNDYWIYVESLDPPFLGTQERQVRVTRYERPIFEVRASPEHPFYAPGEPIRIDVEASTFVGKPVAFGRVRFYQLSPVDGWTSEGVLDADGKLAFWLPTLEWDPDIYTSIEVQVEDPITRRTEHDTVGIAITEAPIRLSIQGLDHPYSELGTRAYVRASYPDDSPAECVLQVVADDSPEPLWKGSTNPAGTAVVELDLSTLQERDIVLEALDAQGRRGSEDAFLYDSGETVIRLATDQSLYQVGDDINVSLISEVEAGEVLVSIVGTDGDPLALRSVQLRKGRASARFPSMPKFRGQLRVEAHLIEPDSTESVPSSVKVMFPRNDDLQVTAKFNRDSYEPGQDVRLRLKVQDREGRPVEAAIGLAAVDSAIEYRAETLGVVGGRDPAVFELTDAERQVHTDVLLNFHGSDAIPWDFDSESPASAESRYANPLRLDLDPAVDAFRAELAGNSSPRLTSCLLTGFSIRGALSGKRLQTHGAIRSVSCSCLVGVRNVLLL